MTPSRLHPQPWHPDPQPLRYVRTEGEPVHHEPVRLTSLITAAITATLTILLFVGVDPDVVGALTAAATAWVLVIAEVVRNRVTPVEEVTP
jgi:hypothetical protein